MKYFAKLDTTNKVISVYSVHDNEAPTEEAGIIFLSHLYNYSYWKETKKDGSIRKNYAGKAFSTETFSSLLSWQTVSKSKIS